MTTEIVGVCKPEHEVWFVVDCLSDPESFPAIIDKLIQASGEEIDLLLFLFLAVGLKASKGSAVVVAFVVAVIFVLEIEEVVFALAHVVSGTKSFVVACLLLAVVIISLFHHLINNY